MFVLRLDYFTDAAVLAFHVAPKFYFFSLKRRSVPTIYADAAFIAVVNRGKWYVNVLGDTCSNASFTAERSIMPADTIPGKDMTKKNNIIYMLYILPPLNIPNMK